MRRAGRALGIAIASATSLCDLEVVAVGGGLSQAGSLLFEPLQEALAVHARLDFARQVRVVPAALGQSAGLVGAAALIFAADRYWPAGLDPRRRGARLAAMTMTSPPVRLADVAAAREVLRGVVRQTPMLHSRVLSERRRRARSSSSARTCSGPGRSRSRGAYLRICRLTAAERAARGGRRQRGQPRPGRRASPPPLLGTRATVVMPAGAPLPKIEATRALRRARWSCTARVVEDALVSGAGASPSEHGPIFIHPFDHPDVIAGQGTVGLEITEQCPQVTHASRCRSAAAGSRPGSRSRGRAGVGPAGPA